jgi:hypothetical protein
VIGPQNHGGVALFRPQVGIANRKVAFFGGPFRIQISGIDGSVRYVRFTPKSGHRLSVFGCPLRHHAIWQTFALLDHVVRDAA